MLKIFFREMISVISPSALIGEYFIQDFLSSVDDHIDDMATFGENLFNKNRGW